ncbi:lytic transglycosylase domain-containing protein [Agromyces aureus]|uniref:aggregation-promoting factor C-terminal-like domain-containing protein n=1 Tax=Agromyces aureus TaxID=453304 RepID=UPI001D120F33|nr:lytic transglycosylase domain-containing protein [Agromyces aureus]
MGRHTGIEQGATPANPARATAGTRSALKQGVTVVFAFCAALGFVGINLVDPNAGATATTDRVSADRFGGAEIQELQVDGEYTIDASRESYVVEVKPAKVEPASTSASSGWAPPAVTPDPGSAQAYAATAVAARGWAPTEFDCLVALWSKESGWRVNAYNAGSGAYGIPQALPGSKMASAGADWETNAATQVEWGLGYVQGRYGTPCGAWAHSQSSGWY